ncbi:helix-turn-helix transcriptional regulator [Taibaiella sp. KBW10]|uniref:AraC family transcriptional regulator n=1 Tax=Taibaiella sp. KBW10 TaxID=2153357 RepID=UPI00131550FB|nr:helix-turn-helix transcriptional regulator [Taibaiella sp. KBW10]
MSQSVYPIYDICNLHTDTVLQDLISIERFEGYLSKNPHLQGVHTHTFYHVVYFEKGSGKHTIDFNTFPVEKGMFYVMKPGQVHSWDFESAVDGVVINFAPLFFDKLLLHSSLLEQLPIFLGDTAQQVLHCTPTEQKQFEAALTIILAEKEKQDELSYLTIANTLLQLFLFASRSLTQNNSTPQKEHPHYAGFKRFEQLLEVHFKTLKLPKAYAEQLFISPQQLNTVCKSITGLSAGALIRNRILLEAKRLLVNFDMQINEIAFELDFSDASNFNKFFKKHTATTPEQFRNKYHTSA